MTLYNKYRPKSWNEVIGQSTVISILQRQVATKKWKNAYLFCGAYGCGKTTVARIFASDINEGSGKPIEIDGASNNGVDSIRSIIADSQQSSLDCPYKVYIIDECHMITSQGWNAALKLIEEPPSGTVFIFCTTNPEKLPNTILSRVQRFDFVKVKHNLIADRLEYILNEEYVKNYDRLALETIAINSNGHIRDAIQLLDKCLDMSDSVTVELVNSFINSVNIQYVSNIFKSLNNNDLKKSLAILNSIESSNKSPIKFYDDLLTFSIDCSIYNKLHDCDSVSIPRSIIEDIDYSNNFIASILNRLLKYRQFIDETNVFAFLKIIFMEVVK